VLQQFQSWPASGEDIRYRAAGISGVEPRFRESAASLRRGYMLLQRPAQVPQQLRLMHKLVETLCGRRWVDIRGHVDAGIERRTK
jgi:hypothetical protein